MTDSSNSIAICENVTVSLNGNECPRPLRLRGVGAAARYRPPEQDGTVGTFVSYGPTDFEFHFPVSTFTGFKDIRNDRAKMKTDHTIVVRYLDENGKIVRTSTLNEVRILEVTEEMDGRDGQPRERVVGWAKSIT